MLSARLPRLVAILSAALAPYLGACSDEANSSADVGSDTGSDGDSGELLISDFALTENLRNVLSFYAGWTTSEPATTSLFYDCGGPSESGTLSSDRLTTAHEVFVMGILDESLCEVEVTSFTADGRAATATDEYTTTALSDSAFPAVEVTITEPARLQPGWTLFNINNHFDREIMRVVAVDQLGQYRWYYRIPWANAGSDNDIRTVPEGVMIGAVGSMDPQIIRWDGSLVWQGDQEMHHEIRLWPDDDHVFFLQGDYTDCNSDYPASRVVIQNRETLEETWSWGFCNVYDPPVDVVDWEHANTLEPFPGEDAFIISVRNQNALYRVDRASGELEWSMGFSARPQDGFLGDFEMAEEDRFYRQHAPELQDNGNILLFDNGLIGWRAESRAIEIAYDLQTMTAEVVWEYRHDPPIFTDIWGDADTLPNGNRLITFGIRNQNQGSILVEAVPEEDSRPLWTLEFPGKWGIYRAERVVDPPRGYVVERDPS